MQCISQSKRLFDHKIFCSSHFDSRSHFKQCSAGNLYYTLFFVEIIPSTFPAVLDYPCVGLGRRDRLESHMDNNVGQKVVDKVVVAAAVREMGSLVRFLVVVSYLSVAVISGQAYSQALDLSYPATSSQRSR